jgi:sortase A
VLAGHTGLKHSRLFTDLGKLKKGDVFRIRILGLVAQYRIADIQTVLPEDVDCIRLEEGKEYCSLVTCTPYGINSHRLVVKGERY